jgi:hypothetical protein
MPLLTLSPTLFSSDFYGHLFGKPQSVIKLDGHGFFGIYVSKEEPTLGYLQVRAPFIQAYLSGLEEKYFADELIKSGQELGLKAIELVAPPPIYSAGHDWVLAHPFLEVYHDFNYHLDLNGLSFRDTLPADQRRILRKMEEQKIRSEQVGVELLPVVYQILARNRAAKGYPMSISLGALTDAFVAIPDAYGAYICFDSRTKPIGSAIVVRPRPDIWYTFMLGHDSGSLGSPILSLIEAICLDARPQGASCLDLGTASTGGKPIEGLQNFKKSVGGRETIKRTYRLSIP